jgi:hypothetical protein
MKILFILMALCACSHQSFAVNAIITNVEIILPGEQPIEAQQQLEKDKQSPIFDMGGVILTVDYGENVDLQTNINIEISRSYGSQGYMDINKHTIKSGAVLKNVKPLVIAEQAMSNGTDVTSETPLRGKYKFYLDDFAALMVILNESIVSKYAARVDYSALDLSKKISTDQYGNYLDVFRLLLPTYLRMMIGYKKLYKNDRQKARTELEESQNSLVNKKKKLTFRIDINNIKVKHYDEYINILNDIIEKLGKKNDLSRVSYGDLLLMSSRFFDMTKLGYMYNRKIWQYNLDAGIALYIEAVDDDPFQDIHIIAQNGGIYEKNIPIRFVKDDEGRRFISIKNSGIGQNARMRNFARQYVQGLGDEWGGGSYTIPDAELDVRFEFGDTVIDGLRSRLMDPAVVKKFTIKDMTYVLEQS